jgi:hypothetical protein
MARQGQVMAGMGRKESGMGPAVAWRTYLGEDFLKARVHAFFVQLVAVERQALDELLHRAFRLEWKQRQAECDVAPLPRVLGEAEALAKLLDDALCLFFLCFIFIYLLVTRGMMRNRHSPFR